MVEGGGVSVPHSGTETVGTYVCISGVLSLVQVQVLPISESFKFLPLTPTCFIPAQRQRERHSFTGWQRRLLIAYPLISKAMIVGRRRGRGGPRLNPEARAGGRRRGGPHALSR